MFPEESDKIVRYVSGLRDMLHGSIVALKPKTMQEEIEIATELMDKKIYTFAERQTENKRKHDDNQQQQRQENKRQNTGMAYTAGSGEKKPYGGSKPLCTKCNYHHDGPCAPKCHKCNRVGHLARDYRNPANTNASNNERGIRAGQKPTCYECGAQGHFKRDCLKLKNNTRGNQGGNGNAPVKVYTVGHAGINPDSNVVTGMFLLNNRYASVLFDTSADRIFMSTAFSSQIDITPTTLDHFYDVELSDERIIMLNVDINKKTENQAKMTKLSMEWKRLCRIKAKNVKVRVNTEESAVKPEPELKNTIGCNLNPSDGPGKPNSITMKTVKTKWALNQLQQPICVQLTKTVKTLKAQS
ncbi:reverse transcriptase domain-containing protein [Tanacetum coccineum]